LTDNLRRKVLKKGRMDRNLSVVLYVPKEKSYTINADIERIKLIKGPALMAWEEAFSGSLYSALTANGLIYSAALRCNTDIPMAALEAGALAAGLSGKGPSVAALTRDPDKVVSAWSGLGGRVLCCGINNKKAFITE